MACPISGKKHSWDDRGLDIVRGRLVRKRRCSYCRKVKYLPYVYEVRGRG